MPTTAIVLDKCYLQGTSKAKIHKLAASYRLVMSDALFYELLTAEEPCRSSCFAKFLPTKNPVDLVSHIGTLMKIEIDTHQPAGKPSTHRESLNFQFNPLLMKAEHELPEEAQQTIDEQTRNLQSDVTSFVERASIIGPSFPNLLTGSDADRFQARQEAERAIAEPKSLLAYYSTLEPPYGEQPLPPASLITEDWAIYRWLQVHFLFSIDLYVRYQGNIPTKFSANIFEKLEHDVLDAQVLMLACLEGSFATQEKKLKRWWRLLCPNGTLYE